MSSQQRLMTLFRLAQQHLGDSAATPFFEALAALAGQPSAVIVWRPGGVAGGNVVTTWAAVLAFVQANEGATVQIDTSLAPGNRATPDAGTHNVKFARFTTYSWSNGANLYLPDGVTLVDPGIFSEGIFVETSRTSGSAFLFSTPIALNVLAFETGSFLSNSGTAPGVVVPSGEQWSVTLTNFAEIAPSGGGAGPCVFLTGTAVLRAYCDTSFLLDGWLGGDAGSSVIYTVDDSMGALPTVPAFLGTTQPTQRVSKAAGVAFTATAPGDWQTSAPTLASDAINRIAAAVAGLLGGPIP